MTTEDTTPAVPDEPRDAPLEANEEPHAALLEAAWGVIANAGWDAFSGNVDLPKTTGWHEAAVRWRDDYHRWLDLHLRPGGYQTWEQLAVSVTRERDALFAEAEALRRKLRDATSPTSLAIKAPEGTDDREPLGRLVHDTRLACEADRAAAEGREKFKLGSWEERDDWQRELDMRIGAAVAAVEKERAEAKLAAIREVLAMSLIETGDELGVLERPADDGAMLDRALRLIDRLLAIIGSEEEARDA